jgi:hypothetical protein
MQTPPDSIVRKIHPSEISDVMVARRARVRVAARVGDGANHQRILPGSRHYRPIKRQPRLSDLHICQCPQELCRRTVIAISDRMPEIGREFYETGPAEGVTKLRHYLESQVAAGMLTIEDCEIAAAQFLDSCVATILKPLLFNAGEAPSDARIDHVVGIAVRTFLAAFRRVA